MGKVKLEELVVELVAENTELIKELREAQKVTDKASKQMTKSVDEFSKKSSKSAKKFQKVFETMAGFIGGAAVIGAFNNAKAAAVSFFKATLADGVVAAQDAEDALNALNASLATAGNFSREASEDIQEFADGLERTTNVSADQVLEMVGLAQAFVTTSDEAKELTRVALDFAAGAGISFEESVRRLGRGVQGASGDIANFAPEVRGLTRDQLAAGEATRILGERFGGAAAAKIKSFSGLVGQISNSFGTLTEGIGNTIVKNLAIIKVLEQANKLIQEGAGDIEDQNVALKKLVAEGLIQLIEGMAILITAFDAAGRAASGFADLVEKSFADAGKFITALGVLAGGGAGALAFFDIFAEQSEAAAKKFDDSFVKNTALGDIATKLLILRDAAKAGFDAIGTGADATEDPLNRSKESIEALAAAQLALANSGKALAEELITSIETDNAVRTELLQERHDTELEQLQLARSNQLITEEQHLEAVKQLNTRFDEDDVERKKKADKLEQQRSQGRLKAASVFFGGFASLAALGGKKTFLLSKRLAQAQAIVDGVAAVQRALANPPGPPFNALIVAGTIAQTTANVARIENQKLQTGIDSVPGIGSADNFPALLAPRERVVPAETNKDLKQFLLDQTVIDEQPKQTINQFIFQGPIIGDESAGLAIIDMINQALENTGARLAT